MTEFSPVGEATAPSISTPRCGSQEIGESRHILCVFPRYTPSFGTFEYSYELTDGIKACMVPQGLLVIAAILPKHWQVRFIDENIAAATD